MSTKARTVEGEAREALHITARLGRRLKQAIRAMPEGEMPGEEWRANAKTYAELLRIVVQHENAKQPGGAAAVSEQEMGEIREYVLKTASEADLRAALEQKTRTEH
ncbi:MAG: hypothetical protein JO257_22725 [Deltaproteobacteria bacterium]|nr:hypothetical protein [Deltaproteobacteria bacterium]